MSRLDVQLGELRAKGRRALVTFITAGDPQPDCTVSAMHALVDGGADIIELGIPFSDPEAEGPAIQASSERALAHGITLRHVLEFVSAFRQTNTTTPVVLMGYLNSVLRMGEAVYAEAAQKAGVDGLIMVNLPPEEAATLQSELQAREQDIVFLVAPTTTVERARKILDVASGFVYYVTLKGITGAALIDTDSVKLKVTELQAQTELPIMVGFGVKDADSVRAIGSAADGVVVGSALVRTMAERSPGEINTALTAQVATLRNALDSLS